MKCKYDKNGEHNFEEIMRKDDGYDGECVVEWCSKCGTLETFNEVDNRVMTVENRRPTSVTES